MSLSDEEALLGSLNASQRNSLETFAAVTNRDPHSADSLQALQESGWDVQAAISRVYDGAPDTHAPEEADDDDDNHHDHDPPLLSAGSPRRRATQQTGGLGTGAIGLYYLRQALALPLAILAYPAALLYNLGAAIVVFLARLFRLRPSSTASFRPRNPFAGAARPRTTVSPAAAAENFVRSVERVTALSRRGQSATGSASAAASSSSGLTSRHRARRGGTGPRIPDFYIGSYDEALRFARDEMRILMVVLTSEEHERDERFKREVLVSEVVNDLVDEERIVVWGGDVSDRDAYQVGQTLSYISLPFVAFIALQPSGPPGLASNPATAPITSPRMRLISRLEHSPTSPLTATTLHAHVQTVVLPRVKPFLARVVAQKAQREADRRAREDAERRVAENARRDEEKVLAVRRREEERQRAERARLEREERERVERLEREWEAERARGWRERKRREFLASGEASPAEEGAVRVAVRLGNGQRVMRTFAGDAPTEEVYAWTECELEREADLAARGPPPPPPSADYVQRYHFRLATTFPRQVIPLPSHLASPSSTHLSDHDHHARSDQTVTVAEAFRGLGKTVNLVVDGLETRRRMSMTSREGQESEEEEEEE
ncbi:hypothetical protein C6P46_001025 [Rhodotorula mucilaginosa]|uniref:UBX domain-containing protein n=1 Tax=Rhodotorula mucilaginosa TaxID=5537 RepID=A0A9P6VVJ3_RHOMI|nr:hypothetical protein C6P46_001025 [Rhodotorula mucilaginosa]